MLNELWLRHCKVERAASGRPPRDVSLGMRAKHAWLSPVYESVGIMSVKWDGAGLSVWGHAACLSFALLDCLVAGMFTGPQHCTITMWTPYLEGVCGLLQEKLMEMEERLRSSSRAGSGNENGSGSYSNGHSTSPR